MANTDELTIRKAGADDLGEIIEVCGEALGWSADDDNAEFFAWKHVDNPFGRSPIWVAQEPEADERIVGVRAMMRWELTLGDEGGAPGGSKRMTRAVDTATLPSHQGRGIFSRATMQAVNDLTAEGADAVFNTPNDKSRPGYLKMGWEALGRVPVTVRPRSPLTLLAMVRSKTAADKWGKPTDVGLDPAEAFADREPIDRAIAASPKPSAWTTPISTEYLRWRTGFKPLACRVQPIGDDLGNGFIVFRIRERGALQQLSLLHLVTPAGARVRSAIAGLLKATGADLAMASGGRPGLGGAMVPLPSIGPQLTWRTLADAAVPTMADLDLPLGTIELF